MGDAAHQNETILDMVLVPALQVDERPGITIEAAVAREMQRTPDMELKTTNAAPETTIAAVPGD